jgi:hypothetical protein
MAIFSPRRFISRKVWMVTLEVFIPPSFHGWGAAFRLGPCGSERA